VVLTLVPALPLILDGASYLSDESAADATAFGRRWALTMIVAGAAPFAAAVLVPPVARAVATTSWGRSLKSAAIVVFVLDAFAWSRAMVNTAV
jgi:hypothetical protein